MFYGNEPIQVFAMLGPSEGAGQTNPLGALLPFVVIFAIFYLLVFRPESTRRKKLQKMVSVLEKGDRVTTSGGLLGIVSGLKEDTISVKIADNVRVEILRSAVTQVEKKREDEKTS